MKNFIVTAFLFCSCSGFSQSQIQIIENLLTRWHDAAAKAHYINYFDPLHQNAIYIGTDATERWTKNEFSKYAKPHFDRGRGWSFKALKRNITISEDGKTAWFDELLNGHMKICRGSGVLIKENGEWKIVHYVLSMTIPNELTKEIVNLKSQQDSEYINILKTND